MDELGDAFHQVYIAHPNMDKTPSLSILPRHLQSAVRNALQMHWEGDKVQNVLNDPHIVGATHYAIHPKTGEDRYIHPHEIAQHKMEGWHVNELDEPIPHIVETEGLQSPEQISVIYAGPSWINRKHGGPLLSDHDTLYRALGSPSSLKSPAILRPTDKDMAYVNHVYKFPSTKGRVSEWHGEPFTITTASPRGWWDFGADHRTGDVSVWAN